MARNINDDEGTEGATSGDVFQVGVNQLVTYLNGIVGLARIEKRRPEPEPLTNVAYIETDLNCLQETEHFCRW